MKDQTRSAQIVLPCANLNRTLEFFVERIGFRVEMIFPADSPQVAVVSGYGLNLRLETSDEKPSFNLRLLGDFSTLDTQREIFSPDGVRVVLIEESMPIEIPDAKQQFILTTLDGENLWEEGRAGMRYRDLIPGRLGGRFVASHISISEGGEIPDYVHYHKVRFQMIYCIAGWAKLVYENQGAPFVMNAGDCVLQPPEIRHRVLESSAKFEVLEIGCPAIHETFADHQMPLPNAPHAPEKIYGAQRFVHHISDRAVWENSSIENIKFRDTGIADATDGLADVRVLQATTIVNFSVKHSGEFLFFFVLSGDLKLSDSEGQIHQLKSRDSFVIPAGTTYLIEAEKGLEIVQVSLPAERSVN